MTSSRPYVLTSHGKLRVLAAMLLLFFGAAASVFSEGKVSVAQESYDKAIVRYQEIEAWKAAKDWENVYDKAPEMKKAILSELDTAQKSLKDDPALGLKVADLLWKVVREDDTEQASGLFEKVVAAAREAAKVPGAVGVVKEVADGLAKFEDKNLSRRLYEIYVGAVAASGLTQEEFLRNAQLFLDQGNVYLAKSMYEKYRDAFFPEPKARVAEMVMIADKFAHAGTREALDPVYAEALYQEAVALSPGFVFPADSQYRRAYNLERLKDHEGALAQYRPLAERYPDFLRKPEVFFRIGVLTAYVQKDIAAAEGHFRKLVTDYPEDILVPSALYRMGLLAQWQKRNDAATALYDAVIADGSKRGESELVLLSRERSAEIAEGKEIEYGLRLFLERTFAETATASPASLGVDVTADPPVDSLETPVRLLATTANPQTGCMMPNFSYEWSGETGATANIPNAPEIETSYREPGLKVIHVVVIGNDGPEGVGFDIVQVNSDGEPPRPSTPASQGSAAL